MRRELKEAFQTMRKEIEKVKQDVAATTKTWMDSTDKYVKEVSPKVAKTIDETIDKTSTAFRKAMTAIDKQTKPQQIALLRNYKSFLSKQVEMLDKRLKELTK